jgi:hypothetical protein
MRPEHMFQHHGQRHEQAEEEDDREQVSHSFSPDLSTAQFPKGDTAPSDRDPVPVLF